MALPILKFAVYYGTITLIDGSVATYTANQVATFYGVQAEPYLAVPLVGISPFGKRADEVSYIHLKPQRDPSLYYDPRVPEKFNESNLNWDGPDFDAQEGGKWEQRPVTVSEDDR